MYVNLYIPNVCISHSMCDRLRALPAFPTEYSHEASKQCSGRAAFSASSQKNAMHRGTILKETEESPATNVFRAGALLWTNRWRHGHGWEIGRTNRCYGRRSDWRGSWGRCNSRGIGGDNHKWNSRVDIRYVSSDPYVLPIVFTGNLRLYTKFSGLQRLLPIDNTFDSYCTIQFDT